MHYWTEHGPFGGHTFLDFINTVDDVEKTRDLNALPDWATLLAWSVAAQLLSAQEAKSLAKSANSAEAARELNRLLEFREAAWRELSRMAAGQTADKDDLRKLGETIRWALAHAVLMPRERAFRWSARAKELGLQLIRARLALALSELMSAPEIGRLRECGRCTGLFLDHGRGRGRRWCRMTTCGNRAKIERFRNKS